MSIAHRVAKLMNAVICSVVLVSLAYAMVVSTQAEANTDCMTTDFLNDWVNTRIPVQTGSFVIEFDATPTSNEIDATLVLSDGLPDVGFGKAAVAVRFYTRGNIDARKGSGYAADVDVPYTANATYHFRLLVDVKTHSYSAFVTPPGAAEIQLATDYAFRTEQANVQELNNLAIRVFRTVGTVSLCNVKIGEG